MISAWIKRHREHDHERNDRNGEARIQQVHLSRAAPISRMHARSTTAAARKAWKECEEAQKLGNISTMPISQTGVNE